jgi:hypothetical protein
MVFWHKFSLWIRKFLVAFFSNLPPVSTTPAVPMAKFTAGVVDTGVTP